MRPGIWAAVLVLTGACWSPYAGVVSSNFARQFGCPEDQVEVVRRARDFSAQGCNRSVSFYCGQGDVCKSPEIEVLNRHALQFGCPVATVVVRPLGAGAWEAIGCNQRLTYQCGHDSDVVVRCVAESQWVAPTH